jgi:hypothetical protein
MLMQSQRVQAAVNEVARANLYGHGPMLAAMGLLKIASDPEHRDHFRALESIADRVGLPRSTTHMVTVDDTRRDTAAMITRVKELAARFGIDPDRLLRGEGLRVLPSGGEALVIEHEAPAAKAD